jgi:type I restriction enzyme S subunit
MHKLLPKGWSNKKLNDLGFVGRGKSKHRPRNDISLYGGDYPFIQTGEVKAADLYLNEYTQTYNEKGFSQSKLWEPETLCITIAANIAETAILKIKACFPDSIVGFVADPEKADVRFIKYYVDTIKLRMQNVSRGTTQDNLSLDKLLMFGFIVPPVPTQRKIASVLSAYDDLIENNTRRIKILEEMARMIYREWFVNFRFPGHEKVKMVDSPLGKILEGWEVKKVGELLEKIPRKKKIQKQDYLESGEIPVVDQGKDFIGGYTFYPNTQNLWFEVV